MRITRIAILFITVLSVLALGSCKKRKLNKQTTSAEDNALAEDAFDEVFKSMNEAADEVNLDGTAKMAGKKDYTFGADCATLTLDPPAWDSGGWNSTFPKTLTIDFGSANCTGNDGKKRRGKIISVFTGKHNMTGTVVTTTLDGYYVNDYNVQGTKKVTTTGARSYSIQVDGAVISPDASQSVTWSSTRTRTWIEGDDTNWWTIKDGTWMTWKGITDDVYSITGSASGTNRFGRTFEVNITTPLRVQFCGWIPEITVGVLTIEPDDLKTRTVDFGSGACDRTFTVEIGKKTYTKTY